MLNWLRDKVFKRSATRPSPTSTRNWEEIGNNSPNSEGNGIISKTEMHPEELTKPKSSDKVTLHIINEGNVWRIDVNYYDTIADIINMSVNHFFDPKDLKSNTKYNLICIAEKKILQPQCTVGEECVKNFDEILLVTSISMDAKNPLKLSLQDIQGPTKEDILAATTHLESQNKIPVVPALDCQENFQSEIRKVLFSLVKASAKILAQSPNAKVVFDGIAARINAKTKKEIDKNAVKYLKDLGFTETQAKYALRLKRNRQIEAMEWLLDNSHRVKEAMEDDLAGTSSSSVYAPTNSSKNPLQTINKLLKDIHDFQYSHFEPSPKAMDLLTTMGFEPDRVLEALRVTGNNQVSACEWLCGERDTSLIDRDAGLDCDSQLYKAFMANPAIQLGLNNPKIMLAFLSILENPSSANLWLNDIDTAPVLGQVFKTYHSEKHMMLVNQQLAMVQKQQQRKVA